MKKFVFALFALLLIPTFSFAGEATTDIQVEINYNGGCTIQGNNIQAQITSVAPQVTAQGLLKVTCSNGIPYQVILGGGNNASEGVRRAKSSANNYMKYRIFKESQLQNEVAANAQLVSATGSGEEQQYNFFLDVNSSDNPPANTPAGTYTDTFEAKVVW